MTSSGSRFEGSTVDAHDCEKLAFGLLSKQALVANLYFGGPPLIMAASQLEESRQGYLHKHLFGAKHVLQYVDIKTDW